MPEAVFVMKPHLARSGGRLRDVALCWDRKYLAEDRNTAMTLLLESALCWQWVGAVCRTAIGFMRYQPEGKLELTAVGCELASVGDN